MSYAPPSSASTARDRRLRATRRILEAHERTERGCLCGWRSPSSPGDFAFRNHLATEIVEAT